MTTATDRLAEIEGRAEAADAALGIGTEPVPYVLIESVTDIPVLMRALRAVLALADGCDNVARSHADKTTREVHAAIAFDVRSVITAALSASEEGQ